MINVTSCYFDTYFAAGRYWREAVCWWFAWSSRFDSSQLKPFKNKIIGKKYKYIQYNCEITPYYSKTLKTPKSQNISPNQLSNVTNTLQASARMESASVMGVLIIISFSKTMMPLFSRIFAHIFCSVMSLREAFFLADMLALVTRSASGENCKQWASDGRNQLLYHYCEHIF